MAFADSVSSLFIPAKSKRLIVTFGEARIDWTWIGDCWLFEGMQLTTLFNLNAYLSFFDFMSKTCSCYTSDVSLVDFNLGIKVFPS